MVRGAAGGEAVRLRVIPVAWRGATLVDVRDADSDRILVLDLAMVDRMRPADRLATGRRHRV
jgi:hypothetical protein